MSRKRVVLLIHIYLSAFLNLVEMFEEGYSKPRRTMDRCPEHDSRRPAFTQDLLVMFGCYTFWAVYGEQRLGRNGK